MEKRIEELEGLIRDLDIPESNQMILSQNSSAYERSVGANAGPSEWLDNLPERKSLRALVQIFFKNHPHPRRMFHQRTFLEALDLPIDHPDFPQPAILHSICAIVGMMTDEVPPPPRPNFAERPDDVLFPRNYQRRNDLPDSFCELHAQLATAEIDKCEEDEKHYLDCLRALTILTCHYHSYAKLYDTYLISGRAARLSSLLGLNQYFDPGFNYRSVESVTLEESRRNSFWLMYAQERLFVTGSAWPMCIDDDDIVQLLPLPLDYFNQGISVCLEKRQWSTSPNILFHHPPELTDPFVLYIKSSILVSKVKRFQSRQHTLTFRESNGALTESIDDLRQTKEFQEVDALTELFVSKFPKEYTFNWNGDATEVHLFLAVLAPYLASIHLHLPHANASSSDCPSARRILGAANTAVSHIRAAWASSARMLMMNATFAMYSLFMCGKVMLTFLHAEGRRHMRLADNEIERKCEENIAFITLALGQVGDRSPLARQ
ncbi:hypothetical protein SCHPADRAFT_577140 [Schizopora paradoxa]|uniref:Xylanolytic transcriptional activator regulatory domain-containing protein n=1 Tax=Schizopora paradoxa TaxID=27342 RepID=A0A0H2RID2_9AGAM|nr:hypothetical protein SCHPADRAFT_577140 [Schizopora paradoxa]